MRVHDGRASKIVRIVVGRCLRSGRPSSGRRSFHSMQADLAGLAADAAARHRSAWRPDPRHGAARSAVASGSWPSALCSRLEIAHLGIRHRLGRPVRQIRTGALVGSILTRNALNSGVWRIGIADTKGVSVLAPIALAGDAGEAPMHSATPTTCVGLPSTIERLDPLGDIGLADHRRRAWSRPCTQPP